MAEVSRSETSSPDTDRDFDPSADQLVHEYDDERTLDEEEAMTSGDSCAGEELDDLQNESDMPIEELMAKYAKDAAPVEGPPDSTQHSASVSSSEEEILENQDLTLDKDIISRDLLKNTVPTEDRDISVNELIQNVSRPQGLSQTERLLRSTSNPDQDSESESSSEEEEEEHVEEHKKTIQVGSDYQAVIPVGLQVYGDAPAYENEDRLLWDPSKTKDESALGDYLCYVQKELERKRHAVASIPRGKHIRDDEQALFLLLQCDNNIEEAERRRKMQAVPPTDVMSLWSEDECRNFEDGLRLYGKSFHEIHHNKVRTRSVFELVHFYYLWKKTERHDIFAAKTRAEKRKYALNPGVTDHMDRFLEEQEIELSQSMIPQISDLKPDDLDMFTTGKPTIYSPSKHLHHSPSKLNDDPSPTPASMKRSLIQLDLETAVNGSDISEFPTAKKQKVEEPNHDGYHSPTKSKTAEPAAGSSAELNSTSPQLPVSALPSPALCNETLPKPEQGKSPVSIEPVSKIDIKSENNNSSIASSDIPISPSVDCQNTLNSKTELKQVLVNVSSPLKDGPANVISSTKPIISSIDMISGIRNTVAAESPKV